MVARVFALVFLPPLIAAMLTLMIIAPDGPVQGRLLVFMAMLMILTMTVRSIGLYREGKAAKEIRKKYPKPKVASDLTRTIAIGISASLIIGLIAVGAFAPRFFYTMDLMGFIMMIVVVMVLSTVVWYGVFPKPKKIKPQAGVAAAGQLLPGQAPAVLGPDGTPLLTGPDGQPMAATQVQEAEAFIEIGDDESLEDIKKRLKPKKPKIDLELLNTANSYDDKVALLRFLVSEDQQRVSQAFRSMMKSGT